MFWEMGGNVFPGDWLRRKVTKQKEGDRRGGRPFKATCSDLSGIGVAWKKATAYHSLLSSAPLLHLEE